MEAIDSEAAVALESWKHLWEEYKYRHDLIWQRTFTLTTAITLLSIIPYLQKDIARLLGKWILIMPLLVFVLECFGLGVMLNELALLSRIKKEYRKHQNRFLGKELNNPHKIGTFGVCVTAYFVALLGLSEVNFCVVWLI
jgi:hypothetical protein